MGKRRNFNNLKLITPWISVQDLCQCSKFNSVQVSNFYVVVSFNFTEIHDVCLDVVQVPKSRLISLENQKLRKSWQHYYQSWHFSLTFMGKLAFSIYDQSKYGDDFEFLCECAKKSKQIKFIKCSLDRIGLICDSNKISMGRQVYRNNDLAIHPLDLIP